MKSKLFIIISFFLLISCNNDEDVLPKPSGFLRLDYPLKAYSKIETSHYRFEIPKNVNSFINQKDWMKIEYPKLKASINITYKPVNNNMGSLLAEAKKLTTKHRKKADAIYFETYENPTKKVYGQISNITGNAASSVQFLATDREKHFLMGSLHFNTVPNYDSIYPAIKFIEKDILHLMETIQWKK